MKLNWLRYLPILALLSAGQAFALDKVTLQLKWTHAFQFAGYYAALEQGYYRAAGLDVAIVEAGPKTDPVREVLDGKAQYGVGTSSLLLERAAGKPVVALAVVFQQSPYEIYAAPNIHKLSDLIGKRFMLEPQSQELLAYLKREGIPLDRIQQIPHSFDAEGLMKGKTEAMSGYMSNEPFYFHQSQYPYQTFSPRSAGIDFYGDNLFTTEKELRTYPQRVKAFRAASMRGWQYAKEHRDEVIALIQAKYATHYSGEYLRFESDQMIPLLQPDLIEIGYMNTNRWRHIADTYADIGLLPKHFSLQGFLYDASEPDLSWFYRGLLVTLLLTCVVILVALYILRMNRRLQSSLSELAVAQQALEKSERHYRLLVDNMRDVVWILDPVTMRFRYTSPSVQSFRGFTVEEMMDMPIEKTLPAAALEPLKQKMQGYMTEFLSGRYPDKVYVEELPMLRKDGSMVWGEVIARYFRNEETGQVEVHGVTRDISERKAAQEEIHHMAMHDLLTGLPNRTLLNDRLHQALVAAKRQHTHGALMFLDLDKFKQINDTLGHEIGDKLLIQAAARMLECVRESDTVARIGGDEFIVLLRTIDEVRDALNVAEKICAAMRQPFNVEDFHLNISCSIGVALYPEHGDDGIELSKNADIAMYQAKEHGRDGVQLFSAYGKSATNPEA
jgi:diguanylate cyclase (GGDEF)-like protein/PAS domain S-box-containing protein